MSQARGHHFISQCYLKRFTENGSKNSRLQVFDLQAGSSFATVPRNVAKQRDFNLIEGLPPGELESRLSVFEGHVDNALNVVEQARNLQDRDAWVWILNLASLFAVRNPRMRENMRGFYEQISKKVMDLVLVTPGRWQSQMQQATAAGAIKAGSKVTYEQMKYFHERGNYRIEVANSAHIGAEFKMFDPVLLTMVERKWTLLVAPPGSGGFLTSDHPVCLMDMEPKASGICGVGFGMANTMVIFPITRDLAAAGAFEEGDRVVTASCEQVAQINSLVLQYATRQIYVANTRVNVQSSDSASILSIDAAAAAVSARRKQR